MRRYREPVLAAFIVALVASLAVHLPVYEVLGLWAKHWRAAVEAERQKAVTSAMEVDFEASDPADVEEKKKPVEEPKRRKKAKEKKKVVQAKPAQAQPQAPQPPPPAANQQAIKQRSQDPSVDAPPNPRFLAEENSVVEEETAARLRSYTSDAEKTNPGASAEADPSEPEEGNADHQEIADSRDKEGSDARSPTPEETKRPRPDKAPDTDPKAAERVARAAQSAPRGERGRVTITDSAGTFQIPAPRPGSKGGQGTKGRAIMPKKFSQLEGAYGADRAKQDHKARIAERKSKQRGQSRDKRWKSFLAAVENFTPNVRPGKQTALNAAASPFANYIHAVHIRIHREYADRFLGSLPVFSGSPYADATLMTQLEIILNQDGSVHRVGVVRTSGLLPFDFGAYNSVLRGQPYPEPPKSILSGDGRVYMRWGFYRNQRQCGTFNAEPYILPNPPGTPPGPALPTDPGFGGVVPSDAQPTWKTKAEEERKSDPEPEPDSKDKPKREPARPSEEAPKVPNPPPGAAVS